MRVQTSLPTLSVVVTSSDETNLDHSSTFLALSEMCRFAGAELVLVSSIARAATDLPLLNRSSRAVLARHDPMEESARAAGLRAATGDVVLFVNGRFAEQTARVHERLEARQLALVAHGREPSVAAVRRPGAAFARRDGRDRPRTLLSVIIPAHQCATVLGVTLPALEGSDLPRSQWELVVVDDASSDTTAMIAAQYADALVRIPQRAHGPAYARNRGFGIAVGECAVFLDADVRVRGDTLRRFAREFESDDSIGAVIGSYDLECPATGVVSQYRNLLHHYVHRETAGDVQTFWAPCGAIRGDVFGEAGMYDEWHFSRPMIEDIELGDRVRALGHRIVMRPEILATHLKRWSLLSAITCDVRDRNVPWMRLLLRERPRADTTRLSLRALERTNTVGTWLALCCLFIGSITGDPRWVMTMAIALLPVVVANRRLYGFFYRRRGARFVLAAIPLHLLYYLLLGIAIVTAWVLHFIVGDPRPTPLVEAYAEMGVETWPPIPARRQSLPSSVRPSVARS